jgi:predicted  nucleic acid-binding Zn-ribbon protein
MFMTPTESARFFKQINDAFEELQERVTKLESQLKEIQDAKQERPKASKGGGKRVQQTKADPESSD